MAWLTLSMEPVHATGSSLHRDVALRVLVGAGRAGARGLVLGCWQPLEPQGKDSGTIAAAVSALASWVTAAGLAGLVEWTIERVAPKVDQRHDRSGPPRHEVELLVARIEDDVRASGLRVQWSIRDLAVVRLLHNGALRRFEVAGLRLQDVQLDHADGPRVLALRKGRQEREPILVESLAAESLRSWLEARSTERTAAPLFCRLHGLDDPKTATARKHPVAPIC